MAFSPTAGDELEDRYHDLGMAGTAQVRTLTNREIWGTVAAGGRPRVVVLSMHGVILIVIVTTTPHGSAAVPNLPGVLEVFIVNTARLALPQVLSKLGKPAGSS